MFMRTSSIAIFKYLFLLFKHLNIYHKHRYSNIYFYRAFSGKLAGLQVVLGFDEVMMSVMSVMRIPMTFIMMTIMILKLSVVIMMINNIPHAMFNLMIIMLIIMVLIIKIIRVIYMNLPVSMLPLLWYSPSRQNRVHRQAGQPTLCLQWFPSTILNSRMHVRVIFANKSLASNWHFWLSKMCLGKTS